MHPGEQTIGWKLFSLWNCKEQEEVGGTSGIGQFSKDDEVRVRGRSSEKYGRQGSHCFW